jgi:hypothetical protein
VQASSLRGQDARPTVAKLMPQSISPLYNVISMRGTLIRQAIFGLLAIVGFIWTNYYLVQFTIATKGSVTPANLLNFDIATFIAQVYANPASSFIGVDVAVGALCAIALIVTEGRRLKMRLWGVYIALIFLVSFGFGFPLFLLMRERKLAEQTSDS